MCSRVAVVNMAVDADILNKTGPHAVSLAPVNSRPLTVLTTSLLLVSPAPAGFDVKLRRTHWEPQPVLQSAADTLHAIQTEAPQPLAGAARTAAAGSKSGSGQAVAKGADGTVPQANRVQSSSGSTADASGGLCVGKHLHHAACGSSNNWGRPMVGASVSQPPPPHVCSPAWQGGLR